jgi:hypothetical protein
MISPNEEKIIKWKNLIEEKRQSGLLLKDFCKGKNITPSQFYYYHAIINGPKKKKAQKPNQEVKPIRLINNPKDYGVIKFILPNNLQCILPIDMSLQEIKGILGLMMSC